MFVGQRRAMQAPGRPSEVDVDWLVVVVGCDRRRSMGVGGALEVARDEIIPKPDEVRTLSHFSHLPSMMWVSPSSA